LTPEQIRDAVIAALEDVKGFDITVLDVQKITSLTSYMVVCSGNSNRQTRSLADNVFKTLKEKGCEARSVEGEKEGEWVLVDLGDVIVHVMLPTTRAYYNLEQLWGQTPNQVARQHAA
jgi:ribosome-associated protein